MGDNPTLKQLLANDLPPGFVKKVLGALERVYPEAYESVENDTRFGKPEAEYMRGPTRRALFETELRNIAVECGLKVEMHKPAKGGCKHVRVLFGRFQIGACHVQSPGAFPQHSDCRQQLSSVNEHISQGQLFSVESEPQDHSLYAILTHTAETTDPSKFRSAQIGFPNPDFEEWVEEPIDLMEIRDRQAQALQRREDLQGAIQKPKPRWKKQPSEDTGGPLQNEKSGDKD